LLEDDEQRYGVPVVEAGNDGGQATLISMKA